MPEDFEDSDQEEFIVGSNSTIVEELLREKDPSVRSTIKSSSKSPHRKKVKNVFSSDSNHSSQENINDNEKVNL